MMQKPGTPSSMPSKSTIFNWIKQIVPDSNPKIKVQDLGDGVVYCKIINHYFPGTININRLNNNPKNQYDYTLNLKLFQNSLTFHKITLPFDVGKIAKQKFLENWALINCLYRQLSSNSEESIIGEDSKPGSYVSPQTTAKRSYESAFPTQQTQKLPEVQTFIKPVFNPLNSQPTVNYQPNQVYPNSSTISSQQIPHEQNRITSSNSYAHNQNLNQTQINNGNGSSVGNYNSHQGISQSAFGGFNFGMNSCLNSMNLVSSNSIMNFPRKEQTIIQTNKGSIFDQNPPNKCWSVGKLPTRQSMANYGINSENSGKYSVNSHIFQNNYNAVIDRVKEILLKNSHDIQKIRQIKILLNIPLNEDMIKIEEEQNIIMNCTNINKILPQSNLKENKQLQKTEKKTESKETIIGLPEEKSSRSLSSCDLKDKQNQGSKSISNSGSFQQLKNVDKPSFSSKVQQSSGKKIKNNFFGEGAVFRK